MSELRIVLNRARVGSILPEVCKGSSNCLPHHVLHWECAHRDHDALGLLLCFLAGHAAFDAKTFKLRCIPFDYARFSYVLEHGLCAW